MKNRPLLWALILYGSGIIFSYQMDFHHPMIPRAACLFIGITGMLLFLSLFRWPHFRQTYKNIWNILLILLGFLIFAFGFLLIPQNHPKLLEKDTHHILYLLKDRLPCTITGKIYIPKKSSINKEKIYIELEKISIDKEQGFVPVKGKAIINIYNIKTDFAYGDRVSVTTKLRPPTSFRNEKTFNYERYLQRRGIYAIGSVSKEDKIKRLSTDDDTQGLTGRIFRLREKAAQLAETSIKGKDASALFSALILGDRGKIEPEAKMAFQQTGTMHLLAVSGLHLGFVLLFCIFIIKFGKRFIPAFMIERISHIAPYTRTMSFLTIFPLYFYTVLTGMRISTIRAFIMIALYLTAFFFDRLKDYYSTLAWAALIILIWSPESLFEMDFQFTFLATLGVIFYLHHRPPLLTKHPLLRKGLDLVLISVMAVLITAPLSILYFHYISPGGILCTPVIIPFLSLIIPLGLMATILIPVSPWLSRLLILICGLGMDLLVKGLKFLGSLPLVFLPLPSPPLWTVILFYISFILIAWWFANRKSRVHLISGFIFFSSGILLLTLCICITLSPSIPIKNKLFPKTIPSDTMEITFMDVGKGDAALIRCPFNQNILIDGGGIYDRSFDMGEMVLTPYLWSKGVRKLRAIAISHPHPDHIYGLFAIIRNFPVEEVWLAKPTIEDKRYEELAEVIAENGIKERILYPGDKITIGPCIEAICLYPPDSKVINSPRGENSLVNNHSLVLKIIYDRVSILFTGDIEKEAERYLVKYLPEGDLASTILKVPHHGSKNSNSVVFLKGVNPEVSIISTRQTSWYPLPAPSALKRLEALPTRMYRTDRNGVITLSTDGKEYGITTWMEYQTALPVSRWF
ncbi:MAG: DNA internalization-related competence protein ComEC/Rec2 [bacterium]